MHYIFKVTCTTLQIDEMEYKVKYLPLRCGRRMTWMEIKNIVQHLSKSLSSTSTLVDFALQVSQKGTNVVLRVTGNRPIHHSRMRMCC